MVSYPTVQTLKLGIFFFLILAAGTSFQRIVTYIYQQENRRAAGPLNFIATYLTFLISTLFAPKCRLSFKIQMIIGCLGQVYNVATGLYVPYIANNYAAYFAISLGGVASGGVSGFMWVSQGGYLREVIKNQMNKGKYSGIFQLFQSIAGFVAGFINTFLLGYFSNEIYFIVLTAIVFSASIFGCIVFKDFSQKQPEDQKQENSICTTLKSTFLFYPKMLPILIILLLDGVVLGFCSNQVIRLMPHENDKLTRNRLVGIITICIGFGSMCGGLISGFVSDKLGLLNTGRFTLCYYLLCLLTTFIATYQNPYYFVCFIGFLWGSAYNFFQVWINVAIYKLYGGKLEAFSVHKQLHCISVAIFQTIVLVTNNQIDLRILVPVVAFFAIPSLWSIGKANYSKQNYPIQMQTKQIVFADQPQPSPLILPLK